MGQSNSRCNCVLLKRFQKIVNGDGDGDWAQSPFTYF